MIDSLFAWLLTYWIHSTIALGLVWAASQWLRERNLAIEEACWKVALFATLFTATAQVALSSGGEWRPLGGGLDAGVVRTATQTKREPAGAGPARESVGSGVRLVGAPAAAAKPEAAQTAPSTNPTPQESSPSIAASAQGAARSEILLAAWLAASAVMLGRLLAAYGLLLRDLRRRTRVVAGPHLELLDGLCSRTGVSRSVVLSVCRALLVPLALGMRRWEVCLPAKVAEEFAPEEQETVLAHELAHLVRRDTLWQLASRFASYVLFFQPLNFVASARLRAIAELRCDDWAVARTGRPVTLAKCLTRVASWRADDWPDLPLPAMASSNRSQFGWRVRRLLARSYPEPDVAVPRWLRLAAIPAVLAFVAAAPGVVESPADPPTPPAPISPEVPAVEAEAPQPPSPVAAPVPAREPRPVEPVRPDAPAVAPVAPVAPNATEPALAPVAGRGVAAAAAPAPLAAPAVAPAPISAPAPEPKPQTASAPPALAAAPRDLSPRLSMAAAPRPVLLASAGSVPNPVIDDHDDSDSDSDSDSEWDSDSDSEEWDSDSDDWSREDEEMEAFEEAMDEELEALEEELDREFETLEDELDEHLDAAEEEAEAEYEALYDEFEDHLEDDVEALEDELEELEDELEYRFENDESHERERAFERALEQQERELERFEERHERGLERLTEQFERQVERYWERNVEGELERAIEEHERVIERRLEVAERQMEAAWRKWESAEDAHTRGQLRAEMREHAMQARPSEAELAQLRSRIESIRSQLGPKMQELQLAHEEFRRGLERWRARYAEELARFRQSQNEILRRYE
ncbi:MAG: M56 family metallopeptidase [Thermoanaerobaculia bacterium]